MAGMERQCPPTAMRVKASLNAVVHSATANWLTLLGHWKGERTTRAFHSIIDWTVRMNATTRHIPAIGNLMNAPAAGERHWTWAPEWSLFMDNFLRSIYPAVLELIDTQL